MPQDASSALAEKLLQGWALLQEHCPQCLTPLVRNRERRMYCVSCSQWVVSQTEVAQRILHERVQESEHKEPEEAPQSQVRPEQSRTPNMQPNLVGPPIPTSTNPDGTQAHDIGSGTGHTLSGGSSQLTHSEGLLLHNTRNTLEQALQNMSSVLTQKMEELGVALSRSQDIGEMRELFSTIRECIQTISEVRELQART